MDDRLDDSAPGHGALEAPLLAVDPELNVFALANGLDLFRNQSGVPDRTLEWYREGMERRIHLFADGPDRYQVAVSASRRRSGVAHEARKTIHAGLAGDALQERLRSILAEGIEEANGLTEADLTPPA